MATTKANQAKQAQTQTQAEDKPNTRVEYNGTFSLNEDDKKAGITHRCKWIMDFEGVDMQTLYTFAKRSVAIRIQSRARREINSDKTTITIADWKERVIKVKDLLIGERTTDPDKKATKAADAVGNDQDAIKAAIAKLEAKLNK